MNSCHLRELTEQLAERDVRVDELFGIEDNVPVALGVVELAANNAMCFHMGEAEAMCGFRIIPELVRLPYSTCWFEWTHQQIGSNLSAIHAVLAVELEGKATWYAFLRRPREPKVWQFCGWATISKVVAEQTWWNIAPSSIDSNSKGLVMYAMETVSTFLSALNCSNVKKVEHVPSPKLQKIRAKRGKQPLFSFWTLELVLGRSHENSPGSGTHASPRLHLRRGHARQHAPGKWTWVQPHAVGNKKLGIVHKDYALSRESNP